MHNTENHEFTFIFLIVLNKFISDNQPQGKTTKCLAILWQISVRIPGRRTKMCQVILNQSIAKRFQDLQTYSKVYNIVSTNECSKAFAHFKMKSKNVYVVIRTDMLFKTYTFLFTDYKSGCCRFA